MMKIVAFGGNGLVGSRVVELLHDSFDIVTPSESEVDITDKTGLLKYLSKQKPQIVINFAAITDIDYCETERENKNSKVWRVNALAPGVLSRLSKKLKFFLVQISTDMVFSGNEMDPGPYGINHPRHKYKDLTWYGASKLEGEKLVIGENPKNSIVRIIYPVRGEFERKLDYVRKILALYDANKLYPMFDDQYMNITFIDELAKEIRRVIYKKESGVRHVASKDTTTPYKLASYLIANARGKKKQVQKGSYTEFIKTHDKRRYPRFGGLISEAGISWNDIIQQLLPWLQKT